MSEAAIDIIIVNYRAAGWVAEAVQRLRPGGQPWAHGMIHVVDNSADAAHAKALRSALGTMTGAGDVRLTVMPRNAGFGAGCNAAWALSRAEQVLLLNPDARITPQAVVQLAQSLARRPDLGAISPRTWWDEPGGWVLPCPTPQGAMARLQRAWRSRQDPVDWASRKARETATLMARRSPFEAETLAGAVMMLRRSAVESVGGLFDEDFFMYFEDAELSRRLRRSGWRLGLDPSVDAVHHWRHEPHKGPMMAQAEAVFRRGYPAWYRWLQRRWPEVEATGIVAPADDTFTCVEDAAQALGPVGALSPLACGDPAWVRAGLAFEVLSARDWALLAPGAHWAWTARGWRGFVRGGAS